MKVVIVEDIELGAECCTLTYCDRDGNTIEKEVYPKPMPKKKNTDFHPNIVYANGWNACLEEIEND